MKKSIALFALIASVASANAADKMWNVGALIGYGTGENSFNGLTYGATVGTKLNNEWGLNLYWSMTSKTTTLLTTETKTTTMPIMLEGNYHFADMKGLYAGIRAGLAMTSEKSTTGTTVNNDVSNSDFALGAQVGWDHNLSDDFTVGLNVNWNYILATNASSLFNFVVPIKYWF